MRSGWMRTKAVAEHDPVAHLIFRLGQQHYALGIEQVLEVAAMVEVVQTPDVDEVFVGIANRHGEALPMLDLRPVFRQSAPLIDTSTLFIVARLSGQFVGLVVDEVLRIDYFDTHQLPRHLIRDRFVQGVITRGEQLIQLITLPSLLATYLPQDLPVHLENGSIR
jgi:purine-binding chemotaxis protein CheW